MSRGYTGGRNNPYLLTGIVAAHVVALAAVMLARMDPPGKAPRGPLIVEHIALPPEPKPKPVPRDEPRPEKPQAPSEITVVPPIVPRTIPGPVDLPVSDPSPRFDPVPVGDVVIPPAPPPVPDPVRVPVPRAEPPRIAPVKLRPRGDPGGWVTNADYPSAALRAEEQGRTAFSLAVGIDGKPRSCTVTGSSGSSTLDAAACRLLMRRARFTPGTDANGTSVGGTYANSFSWRIPED